jgi:cyclopropane-fatty-acyl-phospholipid synthase
MKTTLRLVEKGLVPTPLLRHGIRKLCRERLDELEREYGPDPDGALARWIEGMRSAPVALVPEAANEQHYEVPGRFYDIALGERKKYSSAYYPEKGTTLDEAEVAMLELTCERARLEDGQDVLELGCGWGSLTLFMAERYPNSRIRGVSNSHSQREEILETAARRGLTNLEITTADMNEFDAGARYDRIVTIEMFEHMRNWEELLRRARGWLRDDGYLFQHVFAHASRPYAFEVKDESDWMSRYFFTGGMMPSHEMLDHLDIPFEVVERWKVSGTHYARTAEDWLKNLQDRREDALPVLAETYGNDVAELWYQRWRLFFLACAELFAWDQGNEWFVSHNLLRPATA